MFYIGYPDFNFSVFPRHGNFHSNLPAWTERTPIDSNVSDEALREKAARMVMSSLGRFDGNEAEKLYRFLKGDFQQFSQSGESINKQDEPNETVIYKSVNL